MSNHQGSYMLNDILQMPELKSIFTTVGKEKTQIFVLNLLKIADSYDCNSGEILEGIGEQLGICYYCQQTAESFQDEVCQSCYDTDFAPDDEGEKMR